jgi:nitric oxide reductase subunit B
MSASSADRVAFRLGALAVIAFIGHILAALVTAFKFLGPDPLLTSLPYPHARLLADTLGHLAIVSGLLGAGLWIAASSHPESWSAAPGALRLLERGWIGIAVLSALAALLDITDGRSGIDLPGWLRLLQAAILLGAIVLVWRSAHGRGGVIFVWALGLIVHAGGLMLALLPFAGPSTVWMARAAAVDLQIGGLLLAALALIYWLLPRIADVTADWAQSSLYTAAGLVTLAIAARITADLTALLPTNSLDAFSALLNGAAVIAWLIILAHSYHALSRRNAVQTLAGHWIVLAGLAWLFSALIGATAALPALRPYLAGTRALDAAAELTAAGLIAAVLGGITALAAEARGANRGITGLIPVWLISVGAIGGGLLLAIAGIVQAYLERAVSIGYLDAQALLVPLYVGWAGGIGLIGLGALVYGLGVYARRPRWREEGA